MASSRKSAPSDRPRRPPATTPEGRENQMISLAHDLAEKQLSDGSASAQVVTHYLKLGSSREKLEREKLNLENELLKAKSEAIASSARVEELYKNAMSAMRAYSGQEEQQDEYDV